MDNFLDLLRFAVEQDASDLHLKVGSTPRVRVNGELRLAPFAPLAAEDMDQLVAQLLPAERRQEFITTGEADFSVSQPGLGRFRANAFRQRGTSAMVMRRVLPNARTVADLGLPPVVTRLAEEHRGLVLVTGPTGSGKTTTLAAMIDHINTTRPVNIITIEDPIEVFHGDKKSIVSQREIGTDTTSFAQAMRRALRQDPDVILIGEMRDQETVAAALSAAETGHFVMSTLHTTNAEETVNRVVDYFPPHQQHQTRLALASVLKGVISQRLVRRAGGGRVAAIEVMVATGRIADRIVDPSGGHGETITELISEGEYHGMQTFDQSLFSLYKQGEVSLREAMAAASNPHDLRVAMESAGLLATT